MIITIFNKNGAELKNNFFFYNVSPFFVKSSIYKIKFVQARFQWGRAGMAGGDDNLGFFKYWPKGTNYLPVVVTNSTVAEPSPSMLARAFQCLQHYNKSLYTHCWCTQTCAERLDLLLTHAHTQRSLLLYLWNIWRCCTHEPSVVDMIL